MNIQDPEPTATYWSFSLSPVQSFIAEARRSRDLLAGSRILAWLAGCLLDRLKRGGAEILLPRLDAHGEGQPTSAKFLGQPKRALEGPLLPIPNRASGTLPLPLEHARGQLEALSAALENDWNALLDVVEADAAQSSRGLWHHLAPYLARPSCPVKVTWVLCEASAEPPKGLARVDALHAAAKRGRPVPVHPGGQPVRKCGQCGRREALGGKDSPSFRKFRKKLDEADEVQRELRFSPGEFLCGICTLRRFAGYVRKEAFPSTSAIAAQEWRWNLSRAGFGPALDALESAARQVPGFEPAWADLAPLYWETTVRRLARQAREKPEEGEAEALERVLAAQKKLASVIEQSRFDLPAQPPGYLAVLMFDGDDMGKRLREQLDELPGRLLSFQSRLRKRLEEETAEAPLGVPFYLGGDEGLLLAPVGRVLDLAAEICRLWREEIDMPAEDPPPQPSLSMGIALFGRERPLGPALDSARQALEETAKGLPGKRALAVSVQTSSGNVWRTVAPWGESWERIRAAIALIREGELAAGWPHDVEAFVRTLPREAFSGGDSSRAAIRAEVKRLTFRRWLKPKENLDAEESVHAGEARLAAWRRLEGDAWWCCQPTDEELAGLPEQLHLIAVLARQAGLEPALEQDASIREEV